MVGTKIRVLVVDDSALMRKIITDILSADSRIEVVANARDGVDCLEKLNVVKPDVITLDVEMPRKNGIDTLKEIMSIRPTPVIMLSSLTQEGAQITLQALSLGCIDCVGKPSGHISLKLDEIGHEIIEKVVVASTAKLRKSVGVPTVQSPPVLAVFSSKKKEIVVIGASTGGPVALQQVLSSLPGNFPVPIAVVQHMPLNFTNSFAKRLDSISQLQVVEGYDGLEFRQGMVVIAPSGRHMLLSKKMNGSVACSFSDAPPVLFVKPAANLLFVSAADEFESGAVGVILTGMGKDGADGAVALHRKGGRVIAESQETCVVYGMPKAAVEAGVVDQLLPLRDIPNAIIKSVGGTL